jgi:hypothetical protein
VGPVPDPLLFRKPSSARNRTRDLWTCIQDLWPLGNRHGRAKYHSRKYKYEKFYYGSVLQLMEHSDPKRIHKTSRCELVFGRIPALWLAWDVKLAGCRLYKRGTVQIFFPDPTDVVDGSRILSKRQRKIFKVKKKKPYHVMFYNLIGSNGGLEKTVERGDP